MQRRQRSVAQVIVLPVGGDEVQLVTALRAGDAGAADRLFSRYGAHVERVLARVLGTDAELADVLHETFIQALQSLHTLDDPERLRAWLTRLAVFVARGWIRKRGRRRWLRFFDPAEVPERAQHDAPPELRQAARRVYVALDAMPEDERVAFALRVVDGMELTDVADACAVSLATIKRRLAAARARFDELARRDPVLRDWLAEEASA